ncbi:hypothetical protein EXU30_00080 [Shewanella maritima]|uniref:Uncharacterized protein n=1 Tax=Shewanella maritima TaxID=2520507 RepID=A0A411PCK3_9GAMM|nr:hypothetical protein [Shewanella maritima]QBF81266.1 hypothetical protein EXU30_00080 [Shewanella maritima]
MGSSSRSNSNQNTENNSETIGIGGENLGMIITGDGNSIIDGGAFDIVGKLVELLPGVISDSLFTVEQINDGAVEQNQAFLEAGSNLFNEVGAANQEMMRLGYNSLTETGEILSDGFNELIDSQSDGFSDLVEAQQQTSNSAFEFGRALFGDSIGLSETAIQENTALAELVAVSIADSSGQMAELASEAMMENADLSTASIEAIEQAHANNAVLAERAISSAETVTGDSQKLLTSGFNDMLGLMERFSRSDGAALADANNKTILYLAGGLGLTVVIVTLLATTRDK